MRLVSTLFFMLSLSTITFAQSDAQYYQKAAEYLIKNANNWQATASDFNEMHISDSYSSQHNGLQHIYLQQYYSGQRIQGAISGFHFESNGKLVHSAPRVYTDLANQLANTVENISAQQAIAIALSNIDVAASKSQLLKQESQHVFLFNNDACHDLIEVERLWFPLNYNNDIRPAWMVKFHPKNSGDYWHIAIDRTSGEILRKNNATVYCNFDQKDRQHQHVENNNPSNWVQELTFAGQAQYRVFPIPVESPIHGERELLADPADVEASPYGWHDTNGEAGAEYTITRGNNVHAYSDQQNDDASQGDEPDGGGELLFDYYFDINDEATNMKDAAVTQLFYMNNIMHDFTWHYGFDEAAGNFQTYNYSGEGQEGDYVKAEAMDGSGTNNANFATPPDGNSGRMQMYLWSASGTELFRVLEPEVIARAFETGQADFGPSINQVNITAPLVDAYDDSPSPNLGCETIANPDEVQGKIAMIDRGLCYFEEKTVSAEEAGAVAVIICNYENSPIGMSGSPDVSNPSIPTLSLSSSDCATIRNIMAEGEVIAQFGQEEYTGPNNRESSFDNGVIAHEYGHGISNRLTGGPTADDCLFNDEQMGEGWSDFFALVTTVKPSDTGDLPRGIGNYVDNKEADGSGIRRQPYSTDWSVNNQTIEDIKGTEAPHPLGEIWTDALWDIYWGMVEIYGFDEDLYTGTGGNNMAIQLVMDGMKLQECSPGFVNGRDAILKADSINYDAAHACLIWNAFAKRGIGVNADQRSTFLRNDNTKDFNSLPECVKELKIAKSMTPIIEAGDVIDCTLTIRNDKGEMATDVVVLDEIPAYATYIEGSAYTSTGEHSVMLDGNTLRVELGDLATGTEIIIQYQLQSDPNYKSLSLFKDDIENELQNFNWYIDNQVASGLGIFELSTDAHSGTYAWKAPSRAEQNDMLLWLAESISLDAAQPVLRFYHKYDTQYSIDGGFVEIQSGDQNWIRLEDEIFREPYFGRLSYGTIAIPFLNAYSGFEEQYTPVYADLSAFANNDANFRFRFVTNEEGQVSDQTGTGWFIDDVEVIDMVNYNSEACLITGEGEMICVTAPAKGTIVEVNGTVATNEIKAANNISIFPNPTGQNVNISMEMEMNADLRIQLVDNSGKILEENQYSQLSGHQMLPMNLSDYPSGIYFIKMVFDMGTLVEKVIKN